MTVPEMLKMSQAQLDDLFTKSPAGEIPKGEAKGTAIVAPGTTYQRKHRELRQSLRLAGQSVRSGERRASQQDHCPLA